MDENRWLIDTDDRWLIDTKPSSNLPIYTRFNANDVLPDPITPLGASMAWIPHILPGFSLSYAEMGAVTFKEAMNDDTWPAAGFFYGHLYVSVTMARLTGIRSGLGWQAIDQAFFGSHPDAPPHTERPDDSDEGAVAAISARTQWTLSTTTFPDLEEDRALANSQRDQRPDLAAMSPLALVARARSMMPLERLMWRGELICGAQAAVGPAVVSQAIAGLAGVKVIDLIGPAGDVDSAAPSFALWDLGRKVRADVALTAEFDSGLAGLTARLSTYADFSSDFADFLRLYGYRGPSEWDLGAEAWETRPELALALIDRLRLLEDSSSPIITRQRQIDAAQTALEGVEERLAGNEELLGLLHIGLASARRFAGWRERGKSNCIKVLHEARMAMRELAGRLVASGIITDPLDVFMALDGELDVFALDPASLTATLAERHTQWLDLFNVELPLFVSGDKPMTPLSALPRRTNEQVAAAAAGDVLVGQPASAGIVRGQARLVTDPGSVREFQPGDILIAPQTDPSWTPLFMVASAVVVGVGALVSHAMIVGRELGIPCVAGVENVMALIPDGTTIEVDGAAGTVTILEAALATL